jgi:hypothetical protein
VPREGVKNRLIKIINVGHASCCDGSSLRPWGRDSAKMLNVAAWPLLNFSEILLRFPFVLGRRNAGFDCPQYLAFTNPFEAIAKKSAGREFTS